MNWQTVVGSNPIASEAREQKSPAIQSSAWPGVFHRFDSLARRTKKAGRTLVRPALNYVPADIGD